MTFFSNWLAWHWTRGMEVGAGREMSRGKTSRETDCIEQRDSLLHKDSSSIYLFSQGILNSSNPIFATLILAQPNIFFLRAPERAAIPSISDSLPRSPSREITGRNRWDKAHSDCEILLKAGIQLSAVCQTLRLRPRWGIFFFLTLGWKTFEIELSSEAIVCCSE